MERDLKEQSDFGSTLFVGKASKTFQQTTKADDICCDWRLKGKRNDFHIIAYNWLKTC